MSQIASIAVSQTAATSQADCLHARAGAFVLAQAQALALRPKETSRIRITCGSAWLTQGDGCDYFLTADQEMTLQAGSRVVVESMQRSDQPNAQLMFDWQPVMQTSRQQSQLQDGVDKPVVATAVSPVTQALRDLRGAADLAARGLVGLATAFVAGLEAGFARALGMGLAARARSAHSSASCAQGRMAS